MTAIGFRDGIAAALSGDIAARGQVAEHLKRSPLETALFGDPGDIPDQRLKLFETLSPAYSRTMTRLGIADPSPEFLFDVVVPLACFLADLSAVTPRALLVGIGGGPGVGKTSLSQVLSACLPLVTPARCLGLSLDDFYLPKAERLRRGHKWRTLPGSHDTERLDGFVAAFDQRRGAIAAPRYDLGADQPLPDEILTAAPDICLFDGAMVGARHPGYESLANRIDFLIFLDAPIALLKRWRFGRETKIRTDSGGKAGFSEADMRDFWAEALLPSIETWVMPNAGIADVVLEIGTGRGLIGARRRCALPEPVAETRFG